MIQIKHDFKQKLWSSIRDYIAFPPSAFKQNAV
uniref:Uncharacterized protein n=1 Tax=Neisseria meningitidis alpha522 TaxID=996307 RepID=I4E432_NEIME|nr:hypothetical protein NMALPHA522_0555 [Neisseria meningitidis alpha522]